MTVMAFLYVRWLFEYSFELLFPMFGVSDQTDSTSKPTSDVVENFRAAIYTHKDIFVRIPMRTSTTSVKT